MLAVVYRDARGRLTKLRDDWQDGSVIDSVILEDLDPLRINVEVDLTRGDLHRGPQRYPVTSADALSA